MAMKYKNISNLLLLIAGIFSIGQTTAAPYDYDGKWNGFISCTAYVGNPALGAFTRNNAYAIENGVISAKYTTAEGKNTLTTEGTINNKVAKLTINGVNVTSNWTFNFTGNIPSAGKIMFTGDMVELGVKRRDCAMVFTVTDPAVNSLAYKEANPAPVVKVETAKSTPAITPTTNTAKVAETKTVIPPPVVVAPTVVAKEPAPATIQAPVISPEQALKVEETPPVASQEAQPQALQAPAPVIQTQPAKPFAFVDLINNTYVLIGVAIALLILAFFIIRAILRFLKRKAIEAANATKRKANEISEKINTEANAIKESVTQNINDLKDKANEISDAAKERANELSSIAQGKATELTEIAKGQADKFSEDFQKDGGHKDKLKEASTEGLNLLQAIISYVKEDFKKLNNIIKDNPKTSEGNFARIKIIISKILESDAGVKLYKRWYVWLFFYPAAVASLVVEKYKSGQKILAIAIAVFAVVITIYAQREAEEKRQQQLENEKVSSNEKLTEERFKEYRDQCTIYKSLRQECATAGNVSECMEIKNKRIALIGASSCGLIKDWVN